MDGNSVNLARNRIEWGFFAINTLIMNESFVYLWRDSLKKRYYLGYHGGYNGGYNPKYICSSKLMMKEYKTRPQDFKRRILRTGTSKDMAVLERTLLMKRINCLGKKYYNLVVPRENGFPILKYEGHTEETKAKMRGLRGPQKNPIENRVAWNSGIGNWSRKAYDRQRKIDIRNKDFLCYGLR